MVRGTLLPKPLQQALQVDKVEATQATVEALPHLTSPRSNTLT